MRGIAFGACPKTITIDIHIRQFSREREGKSTC
jgi:hypothetical protein